MIVFSAMNVCRVAVTKVAAIHDHMRAFPCHVMCLQEVDINAASVASWTDAWRARGFHAFLGDGSVGLHRTAILSRAPGLPIRLPNVGDQSRYSAVALEFQFDGGFRKVVVLSVYGFANDAEAAASYVEEIITEVRALGLEWLLLGDLNVTADEAPMARRLASGMAELLDWSFLAEGPLPGTAGGPRRLDYGLSSGQLLPRSLSHAEGIANHIAVSYGFAFEDPAGCAGPSRAPLGGSPVTEEVWNNRWEGQHFRDLLAARDLDGAWRLLSDTAEAVLGGESRGVVPRSAAWLPRRAQPRSKAARCYESLGLVRLRRLSRRLAQLGRKPSDTRLRDIVGRAIEELQGDFPWLQELPYFGMERHSDWVQAHVERVAKEELDRGFARWRASMSASTRKQSAWIKRRASLKGGLLHPCWSDVEKVKRTAVHPVEVISQAEEEWCVRWTAGDVDEEPVANLLETMVRPDVGDPVAPSFTGGRLLRAAKKMVGKASGPDGWEASHFLLLPGPFWDALGELWHCAFSCAVLPARWREARVALVPKTSGGHRPIAVLSVAYRVGASLLARAMRPWAEGWLGHRMLGGVQNRSTRDAFLRIVEACESEDVVFIGQDIAKFFDSVHGKHLQQALAFLRAPEPFRQFVQGVLAEQWRVFSVGGRVGQRWHRVSRGLAQGDPLSPLLAASIMAVWTGIVATSGCEAVTFVDDRSFWGRSLSEITVAKELSDTVDAAFQFNCDATKCQVASAAGDVGPQAAALFGYKHGSVFETLGVQFEMRPGCVPRLARYSLDVANTRLLCIGVVASHLSVQALFIKSLVLPLVLWAGAMASIEAEQMLKLRRAVLAMANAKNPCDTPSLAFWEVMGWDCDPVFARRWAAIRAAISMECRPPCWIEEASIRFAARRWPSLLPVTAAVLGELGWWASARGSTIHRRDGRGHLRTFHVGYDSEQVIWQWLVDWHRRAALENTGRVRHQRHRDDPDGDLAQGTLLPGVPVGSLAVLAGHRKLFNSGGDRHLRNSALATGCSVWAKAAKQGVPVEDIALCRCGQRLPSRPHLLWWCSSTAHLRPRCALPTNRAEERMLCKVVPELPLAPCVVGEDEGDLRESPQRERVHCRVPGAGACEWQGRAA